MPQTQKIWDQHRAAWLCLLLGVVTIALYLPTVHYPFIRYDDPEYVTLNPVVQAGLSWNGLVWAFQDSHASNWHPVTWLSHMLDCDLFGLQAGGHHLTNILFHAVNAILLFAVLQRMTQQLWRSFLVAALFAWHPLHVESVAWVSERKDVLSAFFWLLTLWAYMRYVGEAKAKGPRSNYFYGLALLFFFLGLLSKPMLVTLPFVLLLLDFWPLQRIKFSAANEPGKARLNRAEIPPLVYEKLPFLGLTVLLCIATVWAQAKGHSLRSGASLPLVQSVSNALVSYIKYLVKTVWPWHLAVFYPHPGITPAWRAPVAFLILGEISVMAVRKARRHPYFPVGWFWFLGTLVPVIGFVQVGAQAMADRYTYLPSVGLFILLVWAGAEFFPGREAYRTWWRVGTAGLLVGCLIITSVQIRYWRSSTALFEHARDVTSQNFIAYTILGAELLDAGKTDEAVTNLAYAATIKPSYAAAQFYLGRGLLRQEKLDAAVEHLREATRWEPSMPQNFNELGTALTKQGKDAAAADAYQTALRLTPGYVEALNHLAWIRAASANPNLRNGAAAVELARTAAELTHESDPVILGTLAAAYAEAGQFSEAVTMAKQAGDLAAARNQFVLAARNLELMEQYRAGKAYHESAKENAPAQ